MPPTLPTELIDLTLEHLYQQPRKDCIQALISCSLANSALRYSCQKRIFADVELQALPPAQAASSPRSVALSRRLTLFKRSLLQNPSLGPLVRRLDYRLTTYPQNDEFSLEDTVNALNLMTNIESLMLDVASWNNSWTDSPTDPTSRWTSAVERLVGRSTMKTFRLANVQGFPLEAISPSVSALYLECAGFRPPRVQPSSASEDRKNLKVLLFDDVAAQIFFHRYLESGPGVPPTFANIANLHVQAHAGVDSNESWSLLLGHAAHLRRLGITVYRSLTGDSIAEDTELEGFTRSPLEKMHPSSLASLTHLTLDIHAMLYIDDTPMVRPYTGVIGPALTRLVSLEKLDIWMYLLPNTERLDYHHLETDEWQRLPIILGTQGSFPKLRTVSICLHAKLWDPYDHLEAEDQPEEERAAQAQDTESYAQSLVETMARITYPQSAFQGLLELRPKLGLSFVTKVTVRALAAGRTWERRVH